MTDKLSFYERSALTQPLSIISIPTELGSDSRGLAEAPSHLYDHGLLSMLQAIGAEVVEETTITCPAAPAPHIGTLKNLDEVAMVTDAVSHATASALRRGDTVLALGGDHSSAIGTLRGVTESCQSLGIIYIDAHADVNTPETTITHNIHGMTAAIALGEGHPDLVSSHAAVSPSNFIFIGLQNMDPGEVEFLRRTKPQLYTMLDIAEKGLAPIFRAIRELAERVEHVWVSFDIDSIDQRFAPGVAMPNNTGLTQREALSLATYIGKACTVAGIDIVEMLPARDIDGKTARLALGLTAALLGGQWDLYEKYIEHYREPIHAELR